MALERGVACRRPCQGCAAAAGAAQTWRPTCTGTNSWRTVSVEFSVAEADPVLVLELRAQSGQAWFDRNSLTLTRIP
jgi:hypothetical protein